MIGDRRDRRRADARRPAGIPRRHRTVRQRRHDHHDRRRRRPVRHHGQRGQLAVDGTADGADLPEQDQRDPGGDPQGGRVLREHPRRGPAGPRVPVRAQGRQVRGHRLRRRASQGIPVLRGTLAHLECRVARDRHRRHAHRVPRPRRRRRRARGHAADLLPGPVRPAGERPRGGGLPGGAGWVLARRCPLDRPLEPAALAEALELEPAHVTYALVRLAGEHVVSRTADGRYLPDAAHRRARRPAVRRPVRHRARRRRRRRSATSPDADLAVLDGYAQRLADDRRRRTREPDEFLDASHGYHRHFVGLGGSPQLRDTYDALGISALWRRGHRRAGLAAKFDVIHHAELTAGLPRRRRRAGPRSSSASTPSRSAARPGRDRPGRRRVGPLAREEKT